MDNDISHAVQLRLDDIYTRLGAVEESLGMAPPVPEQASTEEEDSSSLTVSSSTKSKVK